MSRSNLQFRLDEVKLVLQLPHSAAVQLLLANPELVIGAPPNVWKECLAQAIGAALEPGEVPRGATAVGGGGGGTLTEQQAVWALKHLLRDRKDGEVSAVLQNVQAALSSRGFL